LILVDKAKPMKETLTKNQAEMTDLIYRPAISIVFPFNPKMSLKSEIRHKLKIALEGIKNQLEYDYPEEITEGIMQKLWRVTRELNYHTHKKSIAIFVTLMMEKVLYLDISVEEKVVIDKNFGIRDLVSCKKEVIQYLILLLDSKSSRMYLGNGLRFMLIKSNLPGNLQAYANGLNEKPARLSETEDYSGAILKRFLKEMDNGLSLILKAYPLPVFVIGDERVTAYFRSITNNEKRVIKYIHGRDDHPDEVQLRNIMNKYVTHWNKMKEKIMLQEIERAAEEGRLVSGIRDAWWASAHQNGKLLIVEKDYRYPACLAGFGDKIQPENRDQQMPFYIGDAVDDIMEKVLAHGGDVEFVSNGVLENYQQIALIILH
jgi:hypothetical protein